MGRTVAAWVGVQAVVFLCLWSRPMVAEASPERLAVGRLHEDSIVVDGIDDDTGWRHAAVVDGFEVFRPHYGLDPLFDVRSKWLATPAALYVFVSVDVGQDELFVPIEPRDQRPEGDFVTLYLDPSGHGRRGLALTVSAAGVLRDAAVDEAGEEDPAWDSFFDARIHRGPDGWTAEIRIPFQSLRFDPDVSAWRGNLVAHCWKRQQTQSMTFMPRNRRHLFAHAARLDGMRGFVPGRAIELLPALTAGWVRDATSGGQDCRWDADLGEFTACGIDLDYGLGLKWGLTPAITLDAVFHPDFSQIEADPNQLQVNERFPIFSEERRPFFLEGKEIFETPYSLVYSRSINQPLVAGKISGGHRRYRFGLLAAHDIDPPDSLLDDAFSPSELGGDIDATTTVFRGRREWASGSSLGGLVLSKHLWAGSDSIADNQVLGSDVHVSFTDTMRSELAAFASRAHSPESGEKTGYATHARWVYQNDWFRWKSLYRGIDDSFRSEASYLERTGYHRFHTKLDGYYRSDMPGIRLVSPGLWGDGYLDRAGELTETIVGANTYWDFGSRIGALWKAEHFGERVDGIWLDGFRGRLMSYVDTLGWLQLYAAVDAGSAVIRDEDLRGDRPQYVGRVLRPECKVSLVPHPNAVIDLSAKMRMYFEDFHGDPLSTEKIGRMGASIFAHRDLSLRVLSELRSVNVVGANETTSWSIDGLVQYRPVLGSAIFVGYREEHPEDAVLSRSVFAKWSQIFSY
jgi:hypothetical protein